MKFKVLIDESLCKGCALCVYICNKLGGKVLKESNKRTLLGGTLPILNGECLGCRMCERYCPEFSITVEE
ncbi:hypothetical protein KEJ21_07140 [Candidatus Bathyarchaeota archaeon]|nr:hypothetical protein [Candidatus Bathyarchaeota archaeon]MBS7630059.1 hypothetical protein [Candidatus Bathyarchaeota archaeon]